MICDETALDRLRRIDNGESIFAIYGTGDHMMIGHLIERDRRAVVLTQAAKETTMSKPRLFMRHEGITDGMWVHVGDTPDEIAVDLKSFLVDGDCDDLQVVRAKELEFMTRTMTDEELAAIPEG